MKIFSEWDDVISICKELGVPCRVILLPELTGIGYMSWLARVVVTYAEVVSVVIESRRAFSVEAALLSLWCELDKYRTSLSPDTTTKDQ